MVGASVVGPVVGAAVVRDVGSSVGLCEEITAAAAAASSKYDSHEE